MGQSPTLDPDEPAGQPVRPVRRASMSGSRGVGLVGLLVGAGLGLGLDWSPWISGVVGFIVFAELPDLIYRARARRGVTSRLLPAWDASEAYLVTLRRWRRSRNEI